MLKLAIPLKIWVPAPSEVSRSRIVAPKIVVFRPFFGRKWSLTAKPSTFDPTVLYIIVKLCIWRIWNTGGKSIWPPLKRQNFRASRQICYSHPISCRRHMCCVPVLNWSQFGTELQNNTCVYQLKPYKSVATLLSRPSRVRRRILNCPQDHLFQL